MNSDKNGNGREMYWVLAFLLSLGSVPVSLFILDRLGLLWAWGGFNWVSWGWILIYGLISPFALMNIHKNNAKIPYSRTQETKYNLANVAIVPLTTIFSAWLAFVIWNFFLPNLGEGSMSAVDFFFGGFIWLGIGLIVSFLGGLVIIIGLNPFEWIFKRVFESPKEPKKLIETAVSTGKSPLVERKLTSNNLTERRPISRLKMPSRIRIVQLILGIVIFGFMIYALISLRDFVGQIGNAVLSGNFSYLLEIVRQVYSTSTIFVTAIAGIVIIFFFVLLYGVYADLASRSGFHIASRKKFLVSPLLYGITVIAVAIPSFILLAESLLSLNLESIIVWLLPTIGAFIGILILAGALPLWVLHRKYSSPIKTVLFSARLLLSPIIDAFWSAVASFVGIAIASPILQIVAFISVLEIINQFTRGLSQSNPLEGIVNGFSNLFNNVISDSALLTYMIPFLVVGIIMSILIYKKGVSEALSLFLGLTAFVMPIASIAFAYVISTYFGGLAFAYWIAIIVPLAIVCVLYFIAYFVSGILIGAFRVSGVFGLVVIFFSFMILLLFFGIIPNIPLIGQTINGIIVDVIPWLNAVAAEIGVMGIAIGLTIVILAFREGEEKQVFSKAIAASIAGSTILPFVLVWGLQLPGLLGGLLGSFLVFVLISPLYLIAVIVLRLDLAIKIFVDPKKASRVAEEKITN
jgi:hypothetical protein